MSARAAHAQHRENPVFRASSAFSPWSAVLVSALVLFATRALTWHEATWLALVAVLLAAIPRRVEVGAEGLRIAWLGPGRLIRYDEVRCATPIGTDDVALTFASGETVRLARGGFDAASPRRVLERLWQTIMLGAEAGPRPNERALLARGDRAVEVWLEDLRRLTASGAQYREGLLPLDRLLSLLTNPAAPVEIRGAAAVTCALAGALDESTREELRTIAVLTVDTALRETFVLVANAAGEDDLRAALHELV